MFTFHWSEFLVIVFGGFLLLIGLAFLMLRRRNEVLQEFLTPDEPDLEEEFFRVRQVKPDEVEENIEETNESETEHPKEEAQWGTTSQ